MFDKRCELCFEKTYNKLFDKFKIDKEIRNQFSVFVFEYLPKYEKLSSPQIQRELYKKFCELINVSDPFEYEKKQSNNIAIELYKKWKPRVISNENPFDLALRLSIAGNIMDYGANNDFDIHQTIYKVLEAKFAIDDSLLLRKKLKEAKKILFLGDNAGEIVFDKLFIETIMHFDDITYVVKDAPVINDVTIKDANEIGMYLVADVITNGYDAPSTVLEKCSVEFLEQFDSADLIISKGQGNYEGLISLNDSRIFFLLMAKCDVIADDLNVEKESFIVLNQGK